MSDSTKAKALNKLSKIIMKVGYPDKWKDLSALQIDRAAYAANVITAKPGITILCCQSLANRSTAQNGI